MPLPGPKQDSYCCFDQSSADNEDFTLKSVLPSESVSPSKECTIQQSQVFSADENCVLSIHLEGPGVRENRYSYLKKSISSSKIWDLKVKNLKSHELLVEPWDYGGLITKNTSILSAWSLAKMAQSIYFQCESLATCWKSDSITSIENNLTSQVLKITIEIQRYNCFRQDCREARSKLSNIRNDPLQQAILRGPNCRENKHR